MSLETVLFNDILTALDGTEVLARYQGGYYAGEAALTEKQLLPFGTAVYAL